MHPPKKLSTPILFFLHVSEKCAKNAQKMRKKCAKNAQKMRAKNPQKMRAKNPHARKSSARESWDSWQIFRGQRLVLPGIRCFFNSAKKSMHPQKNVAHGAVANPKH